VYHLLGHAVAALVEFGACRSIRRAHAVAVTMAAIFADWGKLSLLRTSTLAHIEEQVTKHEREQLTYAQSGSEQGFDECRIPDSVVIIRCSLGGQVGAELCDLKRVQKLAGVRIQVPVASREAVIPVPRDWQQFFNRTRCKILATATSR